MHFVVSFQIEAAPERVEPILEALASCFSTYPSVRALSNTFVVQVAGYGKYEGIQRRLLDCARGMEEKVYFLMSPLMQRMLYHGRLSQEVAQTINTLTD